MVVCEMFFHFPPTFRPIGQEFVYRLGQIFGIFGEVARTQELEELEISFLLTGHKVMDEHRALCGDGFMDGCTACFADDHMVLME